MLVDDAPDERIDGALVGDINRVATTQVGDHDDRAGVLKELRSGGADAGRAAGDEGNLALQVLRQ